MIEKQYNLRAGYYHNYTGICSDTDENLTTNEVIDLLNEQEERIQELEEEVLDLRVEVSRLSLKKEIEMPHWLKYKPSEGYTTKVNQDIRFNGDME